MCACVRISRRKKSNRNFEQRINVEFCVILGMGASESCAVLSEEYDTEAVKNSSIFSGINGSKGGPENAQLQRNR